MSNVRALHQEAMELADNAFVARRAEDVENAQALFAEAFKREFAAAQAATEEPSRSILLRSAATLALHAQLYREAERAVALGLAGNGPEEIIKELREIYAQVKKNEFVQAEDILNEAEFNEEIIDPRKTDLSEFSREMIKKFAAIAGAGLRLHAAKYWFSLSTEALLSATQNANFEIRRNAVLVLGEKRDDNAIPTLISMLHDSSMVVREAVAISLGKFDTPVVIDPLIKMLADRNEPVRNAAALGLAETGSSALSKLKAVVRSDINEWWMRKSAIDALAKLKDERAIPELVIALKDPDSDVREAAASALIQIVNSSDKQELFNLLNVLSNIKLRETVISALRKTDDHNSSILIERIARLTQPKKNVQNTLHRPDDS